MDTLTWRRRALQSQHRITAATTQTPEAQPPPDLCRLLDEVNGGVRASEICGVQINDLTLS